jgi:hypothetical protein
MFLQIISHTPLWVWGLFCALLSLGVMQSRSRHLARWQLLALPLALLLLGLWSVAPKFATQPRVGLLWLLSLALFAGLGLRLPRPRAAQWLAAEQKLLLPGSWWPLVLIVVIFSLRYVAGAAQAMHPELRAMILVQGPLAAVLGALGGLFLGRALGLLRLTRSEPHN